MWKASSPSPSDGAMNVTVNIDLNWTGDDPDICDVVTYDLCFGTSDPPAQIEWDLPGNLYTPELNYSTTYYWTDKPDTPSGQTQGYTNTRYAFSTRATDPDGDQVYYKWDWGNELSDLIGPYDSGESAEANHTWTAEGKYDIKVRTYDGMEWSDWSTILTVDMSASPINNPPNVPTLNNPIK